LDTHTDWDTDTGMDEGSEKDTDMDTDTVKKLVRLSIRVQGFLKLKKSPASVARKSSVLILKIFVIFCV
jgi:hypothetical protein